MMKMYLSSLALLVLVSCQAPRAPLTETEKRMAQHAVEGIEVYEGLELSLFAAEPLIINPTNMDIDDKGRVWVCEGHNYRTFRNTDIPIQEEGDRIVILEDTDLDGKADKRTVFYQDPDINSALGIAVLSDRVIVSVSPNVFVLKDTDGDDKADVKEVMFSGMGGVDHDHGVHAFTFGPDGKLYFNFGNEGKQLLDGEGNPVLDQEGRPIKGGGEPYRQGMVFRCDIDGSNVEVLAHNFRNNYEVAVDAFGTLWQSDNDDDGNKATRINYVMEYGNYGFRDEMTGAGWRARRTGMHEQIPLRHWHLKDPGVVPNLLQTGAGSPTGMILYEGELLPEVFRDQMIHCDAGPNVVRAYPVKNAGAGYSASIENILKGKEDPWFRPSDVCVAPDGSIFVSDWYDPGVGGHKLGDLEKGRIFRIAPPKKSYTIPSYAYSTANGAVEALKNPNLMVRHLAWTSLHKMGTQAEATLQGLLKAENPKFKARAFWLLANIEGKADTYIQQALSDENDDIRILGLRMARQLNPGKVVDYVGKMIEGDAPNLDKNSDYIPQKLEEISAQVKREAAIALRYQKGPKADRLWAHLASAYDGEDRWYLEALGIGSDKYVDDRFEAWIHATGENWNTAAGRNIIWRSRSDKALPYLAKIIQANKEAEARDRYFRAMDFHPSVTKDQILESIISDSKETREKTRNLALQHMSPDFIKGSPVANKALREALPSLHGTQLLVDIVRKHDLKDQTTPLMNMVIHSPDNSLKVAAAQLLLEQDQEAALSNYLDGEDGPEKQAVLAALSAIGNGRSLKLIGSVIQNESQSLATRQAAVQAYGNGWRGQYALIDMMENGKLSEDLMQAAAIRLMAGINEEIRARAMKFVVLPDEGGKEMPPISDLISQKGEIVPGKSVFERACASCHQVKDEGINFGPKLSEIGDKLSKEAMYAAILQPSAGVSFGYEGYILTMKDGSVLAGFIESETEDVISLRMNGGISREVEKEQMEGLKIMEQSLMPGGLHLTMSQQELVDLVEYLSSLKADDLLAGK